MAISDANIRADISIIYHHLDERHPFYLISAMDIGYQISCLISDVSIHLDIGVQQCLTSLDGHIGYQMQISNIADIRNRKSDINNSV